MTVGDEHSINASFRQFHGATEFRDIIEAFNSLCLQLPVASKSPDRRWIYPALRKYVTTNEALTLWRLLDVRCSHKVYDGGSVCRGMRALVIGAGPCGLRMAMECAMLGAHVVVIEKRDQITRNNVLHLWPVVIHDLKTVGAKVFYSKFCSGNREHISIQRLQVILLKLALVLGVEIHGLVTYEDVLPPDSDAEGWKVKVSPPGHIVEAYNVDFLIGADGKKNSLKVFKRKVFRGKLALGITANLENGGTLADNMAQEIGGIFYVYCREFFDKLKEVAAIDLENFVYFKNDTHYFVMTAKKKSLLKKGVLQRDYPDVKQLLSEKNINRSKLTEYARETIDIATDHVLAGRPFSQDQTGKEDVALFDFTALHQAENSCMVAERNGRRLLMSIVGDTLIEPFWPTGSGVARGFLSVFDTAWLVRGWGLASTSPLALLAERESIYSLLSQTRPDNLKRNMTAYTIDPSTRYNISVKGRLFRPEDVRHLWVTSDLKGQPDVIEVMPERPSAKKRRLEGESQEMDLLRWYQRQLAVFSDIPIQTMDLSSSWSNGLALCAVLTIFRPGLIDVRKLDPKKTLSNVEKAYTIILKEYGISPVLSAQELVSSSKPDKLAMISYLTQLRTAVEQDIGPAPDVRGNRPPSGKPAKSSGKPAKSSGKPEKAKEATPSKEKPKEEKSRTIKRRLSAKGMLLRVSKKQKRNKSSTLERCEQKGLAKNRIKAWEENYGKQEVGRAIMSPCGTPIKQRPQSEALPKEDRIPVVGTTSSKEPSNAEGNGSEKCCICNKPLYIVERMMAHGYFFHRDCFRCSQCSASLLLSDSSAARQPTGGKHSPDTTDENIDGPARRKSNQIQGTIVDGDSSMDENMAFDVTQMMGMLTVGKAPPELDDITHDTAIGEEEESDEDITDNGTQPVPGSANNTLRRKKQTFYSLANSVRLLAAYEIQRELEETQDKETELEKVGAEMEKYLRSHTTGSRGSVYEDEIMSEWLEVVKEKQELQNKQHKLMLKAKLFELEERHRQIFSQINAFRYALGEKPLDSADEKAMLNTACGPLESEMSGIEELAKEIHVYLDNGGLLETEV